MRKWCVMDLVVDHRTGKLRESKLWSNAIKAAVLVSYLRFVNAANFETMTLVSSGVLIAHEVVKAKQNQDQQRMEQHNVTTP